MTKLCDLGPEDTVTSVSWTQRGNHLAVGTNKGEVPGGPSTGENYHHHNGGGDLEDQGEITPEINRVSLG